MAIPTKDVLLVDWSSNTNSRLTSAPATYGTTAAIATQYDTLHDAFILAYNNMVAARASGTRSQSLTNLKNEAKRDLLNFARPLYKTIQANTAVAASAKIELGIVVPDVEPTPLPPPADAPGIDIVSAIGNTVRLRLHDAANPTRKGKPLGVDGASVFSFVGAAAPSDPAAWKFEGNTTLTKFTVTFPGSVPPGSKVWFTAFWFNPRAQSGPAATPVGTNIPGGGAMAA